MAKYTSSEELPLVLSVRDVADILGISESAAYQLFKQADFPRIKVEMRRKLIARDAFFAWLSQQS